MISSPLSRTRQPGLHLGVAYYPEHWHPSRVQEDIHLMKQAGITVVRMGEFAWSTFEPRSGEFQFEWMDDCISQLHRAGIYTVMGTPTAAPPAWLIEQYPQILPTKENGQKQSFGNRCHYCPNSPEMLVASQNITRAMAEHYGSEPSIIGWQIDNEFPRVCYCENCQRLFQQFLSARYGTLDQLNERWATAYWSQTYSNWSQIPLPIGHHNPGLRLEFQRFVNQSNRLFQKAQVDILRQHIPSDVWITHNFMGWFEWLDAYTMCQDLDLASWDWYIGTGHHDYTYTGSIHDLTRGFLKRNFWVMETQPGSVNWSTINNMLYPAEGRVMAWHAVAHGADAFLYWQWRPALNGQEQYHGSLIDHAGLPRPFFQDVAHIGQDFAKVNELLKGSTVQAQVAILQDYESRWSTDWQRHHKDFNYVEHLLNYYKPLQKWNITVDLIHPDSNLESYQLIIAPSLIIFTPARAQALIDYVRRGGNLILTPRTGMKTVDNALWNIRQPALLHLAAGVEVEEYYALDEIIHLAGSGLQGEASLWAEKLHVLDSGAVEVLLNYTTANGWLDGTPAVTRHPFGKGTVTYIAAWLEPSLQEAVMQNILQHHRIEPVLVTPDGVEAAVRLSPDGKRIYILVNHSRQPKDVSLPWNAFDHLTAQSVDQTVSLAPFGVAVLTRM